MVRLQIVNMPEADVRNVVQPILARRFAQHGFEDVAVQDEQDFDGDHILRVLVRVHSEVPAKSLIDAVDEIRSALLAKGEERFVFLSARSDDGDLIDEEEIE